MSPFLSPKGSSIHQTLICVLDNATAVTFTGGAEGAVYKMAPHINFRHIIITYSTILYTTSVLTELLNVNVSAFGKMQVLSLG